MAVEASQETLSFQTEVKQLLHLMIHSLYSHPEIFLRELVSNASDAADRVRFERLANSKLLEQDSKLGIWIEADADKGTVCIRDNGIGMDRDDVIANLGTIARSGTGEFLKQLTGDKKKDAHLIGQFGVGFYSAFIVAERVVVKTCKMGETQGVQWESEGSGEFNVTNIDYTARGTKVTLYLKEQHKKFAETWTLRNLIRKYSDHIAFPVWMAKQVTSEEKDVEKTEKVEKKEEWETVNDAQALWMRPRGQISEEDYKKFYQELTGDAEEPLTWKHNQVEGKLEYTSLLYIPTHPSFDLYHRDAPRGLKLYVQRVYVMDHTEAFLPLYLRFVKGIVDSKELSLNVSRELLQEDAHVERIKSALTKRVLDMIEKLANDSKSYQPFWKAFGRVLKEGVSEDWQNREKLAALYRFASTKGTTESDDDVEVVQDISLDAYIERMLPKQEHIYYVCAQNYASAKSNPNLEIFIKKDIEVLLMHDPIDEWVMSHLVDYKGKSLKNVSHGKLDLGALAEEDQQVLQETTKQRAPLLKRIESVLEKNVERVCITNRLTDSPVCLVTDTDGMGEQMRQMLRAAGKPVPNEKLVLEVNPEHPLIKRLENESKDSTFSALVWILWDQARLASGRDLSDPGVYVQRLNKLLVDVMC